MELSTSELIAVLAYVGAGVAGHFSLRGEVRALQTGQTKIEGQVREIFKTVTNGKFVRRDECTHCKPADNGGEEESP